MSTGELKSPSKALVKHLRKLIRRVFDHSAQAQSKYWPALEDLFTCIDMAANTGHHLGPADIRYGKFTKTIYAQKFFFRGPGPIPIRIK